MKTTTRFLLSASTLAILALAMVLTFSSCSDDDKDSYGTCEEAFSSSEKCYRQVYSSPEYNEALAACIAGGKDEDTCEDELDEEFDPIADACILKSGVCGSASAEQCWNHFYETCEF